MAKLKRPNKRRDVLELLEIPAIQDALRGMPLVEAASADEARLAREVERGGPNRTLFSQPMLSKYIKRIRDALTKGDLKEEAVQERLGLDHTPPLLLLLNRTSRAADARRGTRGVHTYPVYGRLQAGDWNGSDQHDGEQVGTYYTDLDLPAKGDVEPFAMRVAGLSMTDNAAAVEFPEGSMVLIDPGTEPRVGDFVMAFDVTDQTTTFKRYARLPDGTECLKPLNPSYPVINLSAYHRIVGVVAEAFLPLYRR